MATQTPRQMASNQVRTLATIKRRLLELSIAWSDVDEYNRTRLEELADAVQGVMGELPVMLDDAPRT